MEPTQNLICHACTVYDGLNNQVLPDFILQGPYSAEMEQANAMPKADSSRVQIPKTNSSRVPIPISVDQMNMQSGSANAMPKADSSRYGNRAVPYQGSGQPPILVAEQNFSMASSSAVTASDEQTIASASTTTSQEDLFLTKFLKKLNCAHHIHLEQKNQNLILITFLDELCQEELCRIEVPKVSKWTPSPEFSCLTFDTRICDGKLTCKDFQYLRDNTGDQVRKTLDGLTVKLKHQNQFQRQNTEFAA
eukprot:GHVP01036426.1.p1 GENE.GHVP01036426.1~~GHVP01036426.1.p1  ORF type:complete len:249 (-),score=33.82 GHVP01036426.1:437-1183(-)